MFLTRVTEIEPGLPARQDGLLYEPSASDRRILSEVQVEVEDDDDPYEWVYSELTPSAASAATQRPLNFITQQTRMTPGGNLKVVFIWVHVLTDMHTRTTDGRNHLTWRVDITKRNSPIIRYGGEPDFSVTLDPPTSSQVICEPAPSKDVVTSRNDRPTLWERLH